MRLTLDQFSRCTGSTLLRASGRLLSYDTAMAMYEITTPPRIGMFLANVGWETGGFRFDSEIWGPTAAQRGYEGRRDLGNTQAGDGYLFRGRGDLETTGRANYAALTKRLRTRFPAGFQGAPVPNFEADPDALLLPIWAALSACDYVDMKNCNRVADLGNFDHYCDLINLGRETAKVGDSNGYSHRKDLWTINRTVLGIKDTP